MEKETCLQRAIRRKEQERKKEPCYLEATKSERQFIEAYEAQKDYQKKLFTRIEHPSDYLQRTLYPQLIPALEKTSVKAIRKNALENPRQVFNGIDYLAEVLWNLNPKHPDRRNKWKAAYYIFRYKTCICDRPVYPLSWVLPKGLAATLIQAYYRGHLVRKMPEVQEMRQFWKAIKEEGWILHIPTPEEEYMVPARIPKRERVF